LPPVEGLRGVLCGRIKRSKLIGAKLAAEGKEIEASQPLFYETAPVCDPHERCPAGRAMEVLHRLTPPLSTVRLSYERGRVFGVGLGL
jgi:hypothetical protein